MKIQNIALDNKYAKWYNNVINRALLRAKTKKEAKILLGYVEGHHILPKCIAPNNDLVYLTAREHFICHLLLTKMFNDPKITQKLHFALASFLRKTKLQSGRILTNRQYEIARVSISKAMLGRTVSDETRYKQSIIRKGRPPHNKGIRGKSTGPCSDSRKANISSSRLKTNKIKCHHCSKIIDPGNFKRFHGNMCKHNPDIDQKILQERTIKAKSSIERQKLMGTYVKPTAMHGSYNCPHCEKHGTNYGVMKRHHFDRCKYRVVSDNLPQT